MNQVPRLRAYGGPVLLSYGFRPFFLLGAIYAGLAILVTGFLLPAIPNWTGRLPIQGMPLLTLVSVWVAGRVCVTVAGEIGWLLAAIIDVSFLALVVAATTREIVAGKNWRNLRVVGLVTVTPRRQYRVSCRSAYPGDRGIRRPHWDCRHGVAHRGDRRPDRSQLHP